MSIYSFISDENLMEVNKCWKLKRICFSLSHRRGLISRVSLSLINSSAGLQLGGNESVFLILVIPTIIALVRFLFVFLTKQEEWIFHKPIPQYVSGLLPY